MGVAGSGNDGVGMIVEVLAVIEVVVLEEGLT